MGGPRRTTKHTPERPPNLPVDANVWQRLAKRMGPSLRAGKTHSLVGHSSAGSTADEAGLIGHAVEDIFGQLPPQRDSVSANTCWVARVMFLQIHREQVCDLLAAENGAQDALCGAARKVKCLKLYDSPVIGC